MVLKLTTCKLRLFKHSGLDTPVDVNQTLRTMYLPALDLSTQAPGAELCSIFIYPNALRAYSATVPGHKIRDTGDDGIIVFVGIPRAGVLSMQH